MKTHISSHYPQDIETINTYVEQLRSYNNEELVNAYNRESKMGIVGVKRQALFLVALNHVFIKKLKKSPLLKEDFDQTHSIGINGQITLIGDDWEFIK